MFYRFYSNFVCFTRKNRYLDKYLICLRYLMKYIHLFLICKPPFRCVSRYVIRVIVSQLWRELLQSEIKMNYIVLCILVSFFVANVVTNFEEREGKSICSLEIIVLLCSSCLLCSQFEILHQSLSRIFNQHIWLT